MKRLCFGALLKIIYQARINGITKPKLCTAVAKGFNSLYEFDSTSASHQMDCHDNPPLPFMDAVTTCDINEASRLFTVHVIPLLKNSLCKDIVKAIQVILEDDNTIPEDTIIGKISGYEKKNIIISTNFNLADLLCNAFYYALTCVKNRDCKAETKAISKDFLQSLHEAANCIQLRVQEKTNPDSTLLPTLSADSLSPFVFDNKGVINGLPNKTIAQIYSVLIRNNKFDFQKLKEKLFETINSYVFSRVSIDAADTLAKSRTLGIKGMQRFLRIYKDDAEALLGEMLLYIFLEVALKASKILSKIEIDEVTGIIKSKSECIHLLAPFNSGLPSHQLVCGASNICGNLHDAVDRAFSKIIDIEANSDKEYQFVSNTNYNQILSPDTTAFLVKLIVPEDDKSPTADMSFGVFLGYTIHVDAEGLNNDEYRTAAHNQLVADIEEMKTYVYDKIINAGLQGYSFYFYVVPFNDADNERRSIIEEIIAGG